MCPLSNQRLKVFPDLRDHNLAEMMDAGVLVTVNSDDPAYFGGYVGDNYLAIAEALNLDRDQLVQLARNSIEASFLPEDRKSRPPRRDHRLHSLPLLRACCPVHPSLSHPTIIVMATNGRRRIDGRSQRDRVDRGDLEPDHRMRIPWPCNTGRVNRY